MVDQEDNNDPVKFEISSELDLHTFRPDEVSELVADYVAICQDRDILRVRIIHGKGMGTLRETVHAVLKKDSRIDRFELASYQEGGWGATIAWLQKSSKL